MLLLVLRIGDVRQLRAEPVRWKATLLRKRVAGRREIGFPMPCWIIS
jgi:hypothetical protein